uniref:ribonuclease H n=1 Tax=Knipowitschia caucasica TaxID=637954 RepID=A0AAV2MR29_KNICA
MDRVLIGLPGTHCYLDDILVSGPDEETHLKALDAVLMRLEEYGLHVRKDKCMFFQESVEYLGHTIDAAGLHKSPEKERAVVEAPAPTNVSQLRSLLGMINYYGRFMPDLATILQPLNALLHKGKKWQWTTGCEAAFRRVKELMVSQKVLTHYNPELPPRLACDASPYGVGAVLSHAMPDGVEKPIAYASKTLSRAEQNYAQIEREALGIVFGSSKKYAFNGRSPHAALGTPLVCTSLSRLPLPDTERDKLDTVDVFYLSQSPSSSAVNSAPRPDTLQWVSLSLYGTTGEGRRSGHKGW